MRAVRQRGPDAVAPPISGDSIVQPSVCAQRIGRVAQRILAEECSGQALAVVTGAVYLLTNDGELCWLAVGNLPMHARAISVSFDVTQVHPGTRFSVQADCVHWHGIGSIDCATAAAWDPPAIDPDRIVPPERVPERVLPLRAYAEWDGWPDRGRSIVRDIESACSERDFARVVWSCQELIGLGPGLTPSGDDFVGGLLFTVYHLHALYPDWVSWDQPLVRSLLEYATTHTNIISYHLLRDDADGEAVEALHRLLSRILGAESDDSFAESVRQIMQIGHTTGAVLFAGALTAMRFLDHRGDSDDNRYQTAH